MAHRVLLIDADCLRHTALAEYLEGHAFQVVCVEGRDEALEQVRVWNPTVILLTTPQDASLVADLQAATNAAIIAVTRSKPAILIAALLRSLPGHESDTRFQSFHPD